MAGWEENDPLAHRLPGDAIELLKYEIADLKAEIKRLTEQLLNIIENTPEGSYAKLIARAALERKP